jgi:hypothetical protein
VSEVGSVDRSSIEEDDLPALRAEKWAILFG